MINKRPASERGRSSIDWLDSRHTFSFADYYDPRHMGYRALRVINDDRVAPGAGFPTHSHRDMEIVSYVLEGALVHKDSMGNGSTIRPGDVQRMSAGTGVSHSEFNESKSAPVHFLQIWILPERPRLTPGYEQRTFTQAERRGRFRLVASRDGHDGSVTVHQDARMYSALLDPGETAAIELEPGRSGWVHVAKGSVVLNGMTLTEGDGAALADESKIEVVGGADRAEVIAFDLA
jgi:redox-sensitive bicupin YhaK (pirin superfamily)